MWASRARPASGFGHLKSFALQRSQHRLYAFIRGSQSLSLGPNYALPLNLPVHSHLLGGRCFDSIHDGRSHLKFGILPLGVALQVKAIIPIALLHHHLLPSTYPRYAFSLSSVTVPRGLPFQIQIQIPGAAQEEDER